MLLGVVLPLTVLGIPILAITFLFLPKERETLPKFLRWFDNNDAHRVGMPEAVSTYFINPTGGITGSLPMDIDGLAAPDYWRKLNGRFEAYPFIEHKYFRNWYHRMRWTAFRNPINYFKWHKMGFLWDKTSYVVVYTNNMTNVDNEHDPGLYKVSIDINGKEYFEWYYVSKTYNLFGPRRVRIRIGWKIGDPYDSDQWHGELTSWVFAIGPFKRTKEATGE